ncbi:MAG TPA: polysaccharide pyruvyl transferase family protein [Trebonia sp.]
MTDSRGKAGNSPYRVGLFGFLGPGNSGNEASMETVLAYLRRDHPGVAVDAMSDGAGHLRARHGIDAVSLYPDMDDTRPAGRLTRYLGKISGKVSDNLRVISWVRKHDAVIVPGAGVLEATTPLRPWGFPLSFCLCFAAGRLSGVKLALVSVGASPISVKATRWLSNTTARCASYRSYRDAQSLTVMRERGVDTSQDRVFPDLAFAFPEPPYDPGDPELVGVGVMDYYGTNDDRARAEELHSAYLEKMTVFIEWLVDNGFSVRLFGGDGRVDYVIAEDIRKDVYSRRPDLAPARIGIDAYSSYAELLDKINKVGTVVATRYHNVLAGVRLGKPTIALAYSEKFIALMDGIGLSDYYQRADSLDTGQLIRQFTEARERRVQLREMMAKYNAANAETLGRQFVLLSEQLGFPKDSSR